MIIYNVKLIKENYVKIYIKNLNCLDFVELNHL